MKLILAGSTGLIGQAIAAELGGAYELITLGRSRADVIMDLTNPEALPKADCLIHAAGVTDEEVKQQPQQAVERATLGCSNCWSRQSRQEFSG